jgi:4-hydroxy-tetrahydrodipicolinate synthase
MSKPVFVGAGVAIVTPFFEDGGINFEELKKLIEFQIKQGIDSIVICGSTGEAATMTEEEHIEAIKCAVDTVAGRVPVIAGTGSNDTAFCIELTKKAYELGADAALLVTPYYNKCTQEGLFRHYAKIAEAVPELPLILYNVPSRTGCNILPETAAKIVNSVDNIVAIKEATGNISQVARLMALTEGKIDLYSGNDDQIVPLLSLGGKGVISVLSNVAPRQTHDICQAYFDGDVERAAKLQLEAIPMCDALFCEVNPIPVKTAMNLMGKEVGPLRRPLSPMEKANEEKLIKAMKNYGLLA